MEKPTIVKKATKKRVKKIRKLPVINPAALEKIKMDLAGIVIDKSKLPRRLKKIPAFDPATLEKIKMEQVVIDKSLLPKRIKKPRKPRAKKAPLTKWEKELKAHQRYLKNQQKIIDIHDKVYNEKDELGNVDELYNLVLKNKDLAKAGALPKAGILRPAKVRKGQPEVLKKIQIEAKKYRVQHPGAKWTVCIREGSKAFRASKK